MNRDALLLYWVLVSSVFSFKYQHFKTWYIFHWMLLEMQVTYLAPFRYFRRNSYSADSALTLSCQPCVMGSAYFFNFSFSENRRQKMTPIFKLAPFHSQIYWHIHLFFRKFFLFLMRYLTFLDPKCGQKWPHNIKYGNNF